MKYWKYKAYDAVGKLTTGIVSGDKVDIIILQFRQNGWQIFEIIQISVVEYQRLIVLDKKVNNLKQFMVRLSKNNRPKMKNKIPIPIWFIIACILVGFLLWLVLMI
jgi:type II secretory pathway component PulF